MRTIYIDSENKCHVTDDGTMTAVETYLFDGKCDTFVEGYCYESVEEGEITIYPWKDYNELDIAQRKYERQILEEYESALSEIETALGV